MSPAARDYEVSAVYMEGVVSTLHESGHFDAVLADCSPPTQAVLKNPWSETWHPARCLEEIGAAVVKVAGEAYFAEIGYRNAKQRYGPIVLPMMQKTLASGEATPVTLLATLNASVKSAMRGFDCIWTSTDENAGDLTVTYPRTVSPQVDFTWKGVFRFVFEVFRTSYVVEGVEPQKDSTVIVYHLRWK